MGQIKNIKLHIVTDIKRIKRKNDDMLSAAHFQKIVRSALSVRAAQFSAAAPQPVSDAPVSHSGVQVTKLPNGVQIASCDNGGAVSKVAVGVRGGTRYESPEMTGICHLMNNAMFLINNKKTKLRMTREMQLIGGTMESSFSRELIIRRGTAMRHTLPTLIDNIAATMNPKYQVWDLAEVKSACINDNAQLDCTAKNMELIHQVAFRTGLGNSLYCTEAKLGSLNAEELLSYAQQTHVGSGITFVASNCDHAELVDIVKDLDLPGGDVEAPPAQKYFGGEAREFTSGHVTSLHHAEHEIHDAPACFVLANLAHTDTGTARASLVGPGAGLTSGDLPAFAVLGAALKAPTMVPWGSNTVSSAVNRAISGATNASFDASVLNLSYSNAGLFGVHVATAPGAIVDSLRAAREAAMDISEEVVERAKAQVKAGVLIAASEADGHVDDVLNQVAHAGGYVAPAASAAAIDAVTPEAVLAAAQQAFGGKSTLVVTGDTTYAPYLDEL